MNDDATGVNRWILVALPLLGVVLAVGGVWVVVRDTRTPGCFRVKVIARNDVYSHQRCISPPK